jgi:predicted permease
MFLAIRGVSFKSHDMLKNYLKLAWRNLLKDRQFTILNLVGLSTGLACTLLIYLWVADELKVDKFHDKDGRLFQVMANQKNAGEVRTIQETPSLLADALAKDMPEVEYATASINTMGERTVTLSAGDNKIRAVGQYAGKDYFNVFSWHLIEGNKDQVLADKSSIVISKGLAMKLFHTTENVVGRVVAWQQFQHYTVSGVFEDIPANSSIQFDAVLPFDLFLDANPDEKIWSNSDPHTYVVLKKGTDIDLFNRKIAGYLRSKVKNTSTIFFARPFSDGYLYGTYENGVQSGGRIEYVRLFSIIALFILVIGCINFMNLSTARGARRMKEVGIKKVVGASRQTLILQYLGESMLMAFLSLGLAMLLVRSLLPMFNEITGKALDLHLTPGMFIVVFGITLFTGLMAGSYPALYLSGFNPVTVLKGKIQHWAGELWIRRGLVIFQFTLSVMFIVSVIVVYRQITFIQNKNKGFNKDNVISFNVEGLSQNNMQAFLAGVQDLLSRVKKMPGVVNASSMDHESIIGDYGSTSDISWPGKEAGNDVSFSNIGINYGMIETLGMEIVNGRSFSRALSSDSSEIIFNEAAIRQMKLKDPIGKVVRMWGQDRRIAGVVKDFHYETLHENVKPFAFRLEPLMTYCIIARIEANEEKETIGQIRALYQKYAPAFVFDYKFLEQDYQAQYVAEKRVAVLSRYFTGLAILISCLGLFGLATFTAQRRQKEIGIRKVIGASVRNVVVMLSRELLQLVLIAIVIAFPLAWWVMNHWLDGFAYRIHMGGDVFLVAGISTILITMCTIGYQAIRAAVANPVRSLRSE